MKMKKLLILLFITTFCFSQEKALTISQIDRVVKAIRPKIESSGILKKKKKIIGGFGNTTYEYKKKLIYSYSMNLLKKKNLNFSIFMNFIISMKVLFLLK